MSARFLFHDYETSGADPARDGPLQFAAVCTNAELEIIDDPVNWHCRPSLDRLPHPQASLITGISPQQALRDGLTEAEFAHILGTFPLVAEPVKIAALNAYRDVERGLIR